MDVQTACEVTHYFTGAMAVSIFFLVIFVGLLVADAILTWYALTRALQRDQILENERRETVRQLDKLVAKRMEELSTLNQRVVKCLAKDADPLYGEPRSLKEFAARPDASSLVSGGWNLR